MHKICKSELFFIMVYLINLNTFSPGSNVCLGWSHSTVRGLIGRFKFNMWNNNIMLSILIYILKKSIKNPEMPLFLSYHTFVNNQVLHYAMTEITIWCWRCVHTVVLLYDVVLVQKYVYDSLTSYSYFCTMLQIFLSKRSYTTHY